VIELLDLDDPRWLDFVGSRSDATLFHHPAWARLLRDCYGYRAMVAAVIDGGAVTGAMPIVDVSHPLRGRRWVSLPFTDYCPPLADRNDVLLSLLRELAARHHLDALEVRAELPGRDVIRVDAGFVRHVLVLSADPGGIYGHLSTNHRRNVRTAERGGIRVVMESSADGVETFYRLHLQTRRRLGVPIQPRRFFRLLLEKIIEPGLGFVLSAHDGKNTVAAAVFGSWNGTLIYKYGARDERFGALGANHLLFWTAIQWGIENGYRTFDFGRSLDRQTTLRRFKDGWGAHEEGLSYSSIAARPPALSSHRLERAMGIVIRNSSPWVCRTVGELFYRYSA
jgi:CelD/BcsL family acetyltransferase involved in cellulose biosynthesis